MSPYKAVVFAFCTLAVIPYGETSNGTLVRPSSSVLTFLVTTPNPQILKSLDGSTGSREQLCGEKMRPCLRKCCKAKQIAFMETVEKNSGNCKSKKKLNLTELSFESARIETSRHGWVDVSSLFVIIIDTELIYDSKNTFIHMGDYHLNEDGKLMIEKPHQWVRWISYDADDFCIDYVKMLSGEISLRPFFRRKDPVNTVKRNWKVTTVAMLISSAFLLATLAVYCYVPHLRNLHGKVLMAYATCLLSFFLFFSIMIQIVLPSETNKGTFCSILAIPVYYSLVATLFWMNIMSYDIWYKFRGIIKARKVNRRGENHKFLMYCLYGFGCPLLVTTIFAIFNYVPEDMFGNKIVTPGIPGRNCFIGEMERVPYLYIPMTMITAVNLMLFVATAYNIYKLNRDARSVQNSGSAKNKKQFLVYLKIFSLMGVSWILDFVATTSPGLSVWYIADAFNFLIGVFIFFIFVGKRRILGMVTNRYRERAGTLPSKHSRQRGTSSVSGNETEHSDGGAGGDRDSTRQPVDFNPKPRESNVVLIPSTAP